MEEFLQADSISLNNLFDLEHKLFELSAAREVEEAGIVGRLGTSEGLVNGESKRSRAVSQKLVILDLVAFITVDKRNQLNFTLA